MLDRGVVEEFLDCKLEELEIKIPRDIKKEALVEAFCQYVEDDYYEFELLHWPEGLAKIAN